MKKLIFVFVLLAGLTACTKEQLPLQPEQLPGQWAMTGIVKTKPQQPDEWLGPDFTYGIMEEVFAEYWLEFSPTGELVLQNQTKPEDRQPVFLYEFDTKSQRLHCFEADDEEGDWYDVTQVSPEFIRITAEDGVQMTFQRR